MGNGAKAAMKREKNAKDASKGPTSQLKTNAQALSIKCKVCMQTFMNTSQAPALQQHADSKHNKQLLECFPDFVDTKAAKAK